MYQRIKTKQELLRAIQKPAVLFLQERAASSDRELTEAFREFQRLVRSGKSISLVALESKG